MRAAGQHGFGEVDTPGSAFGVLRLFKEKLRYAVRKAPKLTPHIVKFSTPLPKWYQEGEGDGPCGINKDPTYVVDIPLRKTNYSAPSSSAPSSSSRGGGDQGAGQFDYRNLAQCLQNLMQMGRSQAQEGGAVNLTFPNRGRRQKALGNGPATAIEDDSQNSQVSPKETQNTQKTPALGDAQVTPPEKREIFTPPAEAPAEVKVYSPAEASARVQEAIDRRTAKRKAEKAEEEEEADATVLKKPAAKKAAAKKSGAAPKKPPKPTAGLSRQGIKRYRDQAIDVETPMGPILRSLNFTHAGTEFVIEPLGFFRSNFVCACSCQVVWCMIVQKTIYFVYVIMAGLMPPHGW